MRLSFASRCANKKKRGFTTGVARTGRREIALAALGMCLMPLATRAGQAGGELPLRVLIVGGGPDLANNQVAIESNVRYVTKLLPPDAKRTTLFADGDPAHATVLYDDDTSHETAGERVLRLVSPYAADETGGRYRRPNLGARPEGASRLNDISRAFAQIAQEESTNASPRRVLLYFTGHGSPGRGSFDNNVYDLWDEGHDGGGRDAALSVRELGRQIARLPNDTPVTLVMVQCYSGAFGNLIFENGDPRADLVKRDLCGFYATVPNRVAAGCTSALNEAEYRDFTSFFFAAAAGRDRVGRAVTGADYRQDGRIGGDEAFCYALIHDDSIDVPVCTSDVFLRRFVPGEDRDLFQTAYPSARAWASTPQKAALDALSERLRLGGNNRLGSAYAQFRAIGDRPARANAARRNALAHFQALQNDGRSRLLRQFPDLKLSSASLRRDARQNAIAQLTREAAQGQWKDLLDADDAVDQAEQSAEKQEVADSLTIRYVRLAKSVILAHRLRESSEAGLKARYARLVEAESRPILPAADPASKETAANK